MSNSKDDTIKMFTPTKDPLSVSEEHYTPTKGMYGRHIRDTFKNYQSPIAEKYVPSKVTKSNGLENSVTAGMNTISEYTPTKLMSGEPLTSAHPDYWQGHDIAPYVPSPIEKKDVNERTSEEDTTTINELLKDMISKISGEHEGLSDSSFNSSTSSIDPVTQDVLRKILGNYQSLVRIAQSTCQSTSENNKTSNSIAALQKQPIRGILSSGIKGSENTTRSVVFADTINLQLIHYREIESRLDAYGLSMSESESETEHNSENEDSFAEERRDQVGELKVIKKTLGVKKTVFKKKEPVLEVVSLESSPLNLTLLSVKGAIPLVEITASKDEELIDDDIDIYTDEDHNNLADKVYKKNRPALIPLECAEPKSVDPRLEEPSIREEKRISNTFKKNMRTLSTGIGSSRTKIFSQNKFLPFLQVPIEAKPAEPGALRAYLNQPAVDHPGFMLKSQKRQMPCEEEKSAGTLPKRQCLGSTSDNTQ
uniref:Muscular LMNA-interacting protein n=1 Tax=Caenorhabditis tropicalis TaxID=1561998 RepID=A0A1I7TL79_9PELO